jgi:hypothetical protein
MVKLSMACSSIEELNAKKVRWPSVEFESPGFSNGQIGFGYPVQLFGRNCVAAYPGNKLAAQLELVLNIKLVIS